ncbi:MAG TPA: rhomboid family intramembrane serine protease [Mycobacteriales bacterium]|nr:rhomboid family intramembrane serine protease [Mycobacteriales bacterium]
MSADGPTGTGRDAADPGLGAETTCYRHPRRPASVRCVRCDRYICPDCMRPAAVGFQCPECVAEGSRTIRTPRTVYGGRVAAGPPIVTYGLIGINVAIFLVTAIGGTSLGFSGGASPLYGRLALIPYDVGVAGQYDRLLSSMFLHYGLVHIAANMYALYLVGPTLERILGRVRYLMLYFGAGLGGSVAVYLFSGPGQPTAGASGAIFGLFAAFVVFARHQRRDATAMVGVIVLNLVLTFTISGISIWGHVGGLVIGAAIAALLAYAPAGRWRSAVQAGGLLVLAVVLVAACAVRTHDLRQTYLPAQLAGLAASIAAATLGVSPPTR